MQYLSGMIKKMNSAMYLLRALTVPDTWKELNNEDVLFLEHENDRSMIIEGKSYGQLCGSIRFFLEKKGMSCVNVSQPYQRIPSNHLYYEDKTINRIFSLAVLLKKMVSFVTRRNYIEVSRNIDTRIWTRILKRAKPKIVIGIQPSEGFCMACHLLSIPIYDLQHGVMDDISPAYGSSFNLEKDRRYLPTSYLCWDEESSVVLDRWCANRNIQVIVLGNPWLYRFYKQYESDSVVHSVLNEPPFNQSKKCILVSLQWKLDLCYPEFFGSDQFLHSAIIDAVKALDDDVNWLIRLHPIQMKSPKILQELDRVFASHKNVYIHWASSMPLPVVLSFSHGHVTWDSSTVLDASLFGVKTYLLNPGQFSVSHASSQYKQSSKAFFELPFRKQESDGLLQRANGFPNTQPFVEWINQLNPRNKPDITPIIFDENKLYELVTSQDQLN